MKKGRIHERTQKEKSFCFVFLLLLLLDLCLFYRNVQFMEDIGNNNSSIALIQDDAMLQQHTGRKCLG